MFLVEKKNSITTNSIITLLLNKDLCLAFFSAVCLLTIDISKVTKIDRQIMICEKLLYL